MFVGGGFKPSEKYTRQFLLAFPHVGVKITFHKKMKPPPP